MRRRTTNSAFGKATLQTISSYLAPGFLLAGLVSLAYQILSHFIVPAVWAVILVYMTWPLHRLIARILVEKQTLAALATTLLLASFLVIPLVWASFLLQAEIAEVFSDVPGWLDRKPAVPEFAARIPYLSKELGRFFEQAESLRELLRLRVLPWLRQYSTELLNLLGNVGHNAAKLGLALLTAFFLYRDGPEVSGQVKRMLRAMLGQRLDNYVATTEQTLKAVVYGIVLTAIAQGGLAGLGYWMFGTGAPILLCLLTILLAMIPFGAPLVWVSASVGLLSNGEYWEGVSLFLWGALVVSWIDNIIRPLVISGATRIPFILVCFGVLGGLIRFGFIGMFVGPVVLAICYAVWREWLEHHAATSENRSPNSVDDIR